MKRNKEAELVARHTDSGGTMSSDSCTVTSMLG